MNSIKEEQTNDSNLLESINVFKMSIAYIDLFFSGFITQNASNNQIIAIVGWIIWLIGIFLAFSPNVVFKRRGGVPKGNSYTQTTKLVKDGIYGLIRHPQYRGGMVIAFSMCLFLQTPLTYFLAIIAWITAYLSMIFEEKRLINQVWY